MKQIVLTMLIFGLLPFCCSCGKEASVFTPVTESLPYLEGRELFCLADSREQAEEIASLYGITVVDFSYGVATFHTQEDPLAVAARGKKEGWPLIDVNYIAAVPDGAALPPDGVR